ncbi:MAG: sodium:proton antiporter [Herbaspirillum sp.]|nr:sodium:proton antiporter [Herbaspirillum sp.]
MGWFFPSFNFGQTMHWNALLLFGSLLLFGLIGAHLVTKMRWVPRLTGYLIVGFILGEGGLNILSGDVLKSLNVFADIAVALVVYQLGRYVDIGWLRRERWLLATVLVSSLLCFIFVSSALSWLGMSHIVAMLAGILSIATAPAVVLVVLRDLRAEGQVTRRLAVMTALNNVVALLATYMLLPMVIREDDASIWNLIWQAIYAVGGSFLLAYVTYLLMMPLVRLFGRQRGRQFVLVIAVMALAIGAAHALNLPVLLTMLTFAIVSKNLDFRFDLMELEFGPTNELFIVMLFVAVGASMRWSDLSTVGVAVLVLIAARLAAMGCGVFLFARVARMKWSQAGLIVLGTLPMTEAGVGLMQAIAHFSPHTTAAVVPLLAGCLIVLEFCGPLAVQFALLKSGESGRE